MCLKGKMWGGWVFWWCWLGNRAVFWYFGHMNEFQCRCLEKYLGGTRHLDFFHIMLFSKIDFQKCYFVLSTVLLETILIKVNLFTVSWLCEPKVVASMNEINKQKRLRDASQMAAEAEKIKAPRYVFSAALGVW